ncbi:hypothetical protein HK097_002384 [Rhizophlyctis rosea]|uniref:tRNA ligase n=1 Tax=Rhizophlyctis rosea TaxID=64517 RepID=A0AAD5X392_9FUNG|nr:hypothetical protein HK097_002384 [Rhizophlyctis rosea]
MSKRKVSGSAPRSPYGSKDAIADQRNGNTPQIASPAFTPGDHTSMVAAFDSLTRRDGRSRPIVRKTLYNWKPDGAGREVPIYSYNCLEWMYRKQPSPFPTMARGLFVTQVEGTEKWHIVVRGYDKFFNVGEVTETSWPYLKEHSTGPYEVTLKENGCIIFVSALNDNLIVTSKHALGPARDTSTGKPSHAQKGEEWLRRHLKAVDKTPLELARYLQENNITAVFELVDDDFEEHILEYPPETRGLWLHGINENVPEFRTWASERIAPFSQQFGMFKVEALKMDTIDEVIAFTDNVRQTGSYGGRAVEGFVVRCQDRNRPSDVHFFKVKYDEPYLMFREWREVTNRILSPKGMGNFRPRFELTRKYVEWVRRKLQTHPELFADFRQQKGIIRARNMFLEETKIPGIGQHIVEEARRTTQDYRLGMATIKGEGEEEEQKLRDDLKAERQAATHNIGRPSPAAAQGSGGANKLLILPIACIGAGKTTLARILKNLYPNVEHIQSDNILAKRRGAFEREVMSAFENYDVVIADKNNHMSMHRDEITKDFKWRYPEGRIIALDWEIEKMNRNECVRIAADRVLQRGENHQSLTPGRTKDFENVIWSFVIRRDPLNLRSPTDKLIDEVVPLKMVDPQRAHLPAVCAAVGWPEPTPEEFDIAYEAALAHKETVVKIVADNSARKKVLYYGVKVPTEFDIVAFLEGQFARCPDKKGFWDQLVRDGRIEMHRAKGWHVTLSMNRPDLKEVVKNFEDLLKAGTEQNGDRSSEEERKVPVKLNLDEIVWDDRAMAIAIKSMDPSLPCANKIPHITVATASDEIKPFISNNILAASRNHCLGNGEVCNLKLAEGTVIVGYLKGFAY